MKVNLEFISDIINSYITELEHQYQEGTIDLEEKIYKSDAAKQIKNSLKEFIKASNSL